MKMAKIKEKYINFVNSILDETLKQKFCKVMGSGFFLLEDNVYFFIDTAGGGKEVKVNFLLGKKAEVFAEVLAENLNLN